MRRVHQPLRLLLNAARSSATLAAETATAAAARREPSPVLGALRSWREAPVRSSAALWCPGLAKAAMPGHRLSVGLRGILGRGSGLGSLMMSLQRRGRGRGFNSRGFFSSAQRYLSNLTPDEVVYGLIGANVAVFFLWRIANSTFMMKHFMISLDNVKNGRLHTMVTSAFSHADLDHIFSNMLGLYFFGTNIANLFGPQFLLNLYLAGAVGGSVFFLAHKAFLSRSEMGNYRSNPSRTPALGASAAVNAIILLDVFLFPTKMVYLQLLIPVPAFVMGALFIGTDLWRMAKGDSRVSGSAHLGGAAVAALAFARIKGFIRF